MKITAANLEYDHTAVGNLLDNVFDSLSACDADRSFQQLDLLWARLAVHIRAEHLWLFPSLLRAANGKGQSALRAHEIHDEIENLRDDHDFFMRTLARAVRLFRDSDKSGQAQCEEARQLLSEFKSTLDKHNALEERHVYRWADAMLTEHERDEISARMQRELENMPPRFSAAGSKKPPAQTISDIIKFDKSLNPIAKGKENS